MTFKNKCPILLATMLCTSLLFSCTTVERDNPYDAGGTNYMGSGSDSKASIACYLEVYEDWAYCLKPMTRSKCQEISNSEGLEVSFLESCPSGYRYDCGVSKSNGVNVYVYGEDAEPEDCEDFFYYLY